LQLSRHYNKKNENGSKERISMKNNENGSEKKTGTTFSLPYNLHVFL
jgi:hypothetical protein